jgi:hypothetical protein
VRPREPGSGPAAQRECLRHQGRADAPATGLLGDDEFQLAVTDHRDPVVDGQDGRAPRADVDQGLVGERGSLAGGDEAAEVGEHYCPIRRSASSS